MELSFSIHSIKRMEERNIGFAEVLECLHFPDKTEKDEENTVKFYKLIEENVLILVCSMTEEQCKIVTVIKSSKIEKHL